MIEILYRFWKRACDNLGIVGVDLYGGTRHSAMRYYREHMSMKDVTRLSFHTVSKTSLHYVNISQGELLRDTLSGVEHLWNTAKRKPLV